MSKEIKIIIFISEHLNLKCYYKHIYKMICIEVLQQKKTLLKRYMYNIIAILKINSKGDI